MCKTKRRKRDIGSIFLITLAVIALSALVGGGGYAVYRIMDEDNRTNDEHRSINGSEIAYATTNMFRLFRDAQYDYIHRHGGVMASSITELGDGFSMSSYGALIYREIWLARWDRPQNDYLPASQQDSLERGILARPYRYAVMPVRECRGEKLDQRTTCIVAIPVSLEEAPALVLLGGPIRSDPRDFVRQYPVHKVANAESIRAFRDALTQGLPIGRQFLDVHLPNWEETSLVRNVESNSTKQAIY